MENRVSCAQLDDLLDYLITHPQLVKGIGLGARSKEAIAREWDNLASKLNAHGLGATKTSQRWKRYWADLKHKVKAKAAERKRIAYGTGGGPAHHDELNELEKKVLAIIGEGAIFGDTQHRVPAITTTIVPKEPLSSGLVVASEDQGIAQETVVLTTDSPPPASTPDLSSHLLNSPSQRGQTRVYAAQAEMSPSTPEQPINDIIVSPVSRRPGSHPRRSFIANTRTKFRQQTRVDSSWVIELEKKRVEAEGKLADAVLIIAEAARTQAEAARTQAEAARTQANAQQLQAEVNASQHKMLEKLISTIIKNK
ncbi:uncharacterized protein LOC114246117 isoform X2 [Bombyx mandarina]|uniref:Regulatory protein zeste n=1 Tax=Bombyx mandarina TaxID=7092 RepID=A0A6J2JY09_BOMMA|nr:uncharacterized protein LOC114246117 isoform X2 [Bombyx mandarina]